MQRTLTAVANLAILIVAVSILYVLFARQRQQPLPSARLNPQAEVGRHMPFSAQWQRKNVVLVLQEGCHFCADSAPFYRELLSQTNSKGVSIFAVLPQSHSVSTAYVEQDLGLQIPSESIFSKKLDSLSVSGTPTLFIVNEQGVVTQAWQGQLKPQKQNDVLQSLN